MLSDIGDIRWQNEVPGHKEKWIPIVSPKPKQPITVLVTSERWVGVSTHYYDDRTRPCTGSELDCEGCYRKLAHRWKAYLAAVLQGSGRECIAEMTHGALQACPQMVDRSTNLRGKRLVLWRGGTAKNGPLHIRLESSAADLFVPPPFDLMPALCRIWGIAPPQSP